MTSVPPTTTPWGPLSPDTMRHALEEPSPDHIVDVAASLFASQGISATTMRQIASEAGLSRAWLYRKYANRDLIAQAVLMREGRRIATALVEADEPRTPAEVAVTHTVVHVIHTLRSNPLVRRIMETERELLSVYLTADSGPFMASAAGFLDSYLRRRAGLPERDSRIAADAIVRLIVSVGLLPNVLLDMDDREQLREFVTRVLSPLLDATTVGSGRGTT